jgi:hypothetical protein
VPVLWIFARTRRVFAAISVLFVNLDPECKYPQHAVLFILYTRGIFVFIFREFSDVNIARREKLFTVIILRWG